MQLRFQDEVCSVLLCVHIPYASPCCVSIWLPSRSYVATYPLSYALCAAVISLCSMCMVCVSCLSLIVFVSVNFMFVVENESVAWRVFV